MKKITAYKVTVKSDDARGKSFQIGDGEIYDCIDKEIYILTDDPTEIYNKIFTKNIISVEKVGIGYNLDK